MSEYTFKLSSTEDIQKWPDPTWIIKKILPQDSLTQVVGSSTVGKSFLVLDWALSIAAGIPWGGVYEVKQGPVLYVFGEGKSGIKQRINAWFDHNNLTHRRADIPFFAIDRPLQLAKEGYGDINKFAEEVDEQLGELPNPQLIIFDTLARCMAGADENSAQDMGRAIDAVSYLRKGYGCTALLVHHTGYGSGRRGRGSSSLPAGLDTDFLIERKEDSRVMTIESLKTKDGKKIDKLAVTLIDSIEKDEDGDPKTLVATLGGRVPISEPGDALGKNKNGRKLLEHIVEECPMGDSYSNLRSLGVISDGSFHRTLSKLQELGFVENTGSFYEPTQQAFTVFERRNFN